jgi:hypothetical protein
LHNGLLISLSGRKALISQALLEMGMPSERHKALLRNIPSYSIPG